MKRPGFSLIEVIIATAILLASVVVLSELAGIGRRQSQRADLQTQAHEVCQRTLNEILLGDRPTTDVENEPLLPPEAAVAEFQDLDAQLIDEDEELLIFETPEERAMLAGGGELSESKWLYTVRVVPLPDMPGLVALTVIVKQSDEQLKRPVRFRLTRWVEAAQSFSGDEISGTTGFGFSPGGQR